MIIILERGHQKPPAPTSVMSPLIPLVGSVFLLLVLATVVIFLPLYVLSIQQAKRIFLPLDFAIFYSLLW